jgi:hypothetical protein
MTDTTIVPAAPTIEPPRESWTDTQKILALLYSVAFILVIILLIFTSPKADPQIFAVLTTLVGVLANQVGNIVSYYFGSTKTSQTKDATIQALSSPPTVKIAP